jgi:hypothetical protein
MDNMVSSKRMHDVSILNTLYAKFEGNDKKHKVEVNQAMSSFYIASHRGHGSIVVKIFYVDSGWTWRAVIHRKKTCHQGFCMERFFFDGSVDGNN